MKSTIFILLVILFQSNSFGQENEKWRNEEGFNSIFQNLDSGNFRGTTNGVLIIENTNRQKMILDFQGSVGNLEIIKDEYEVYDVSTKTYRGKTTSGNTEIKYETYAGANGLGVKLNEQWFELSAIDGGCDMVINGLNYTYQAEQSTEYLIININKEVELNNWQFLIRTEHTMKPDNIDDLKPRKRTIKLLPNSTLIFAIKRK